MRDILNKVVAAEKEAEANVIRRREETNATRSLLNTAKVMARMNAAKPAAAIRANLSLGFALITD